MPLWSVVISSLVLFTTASVALPHPPQPGGLTPPNAFAIFEAPNERAAPTPMHPVLKRLAWAAQPVVIAPRSGSRSAAHSATSAPRSCSTATERSISRRPKRPSPTVGGGPIPPSGRFPSTTPCRSRRAPALIRPGAGRGPLLGRRRASRDLDVVRDAPPRRRVRSVVSATARRLRHRRLEQGSCLP